MVTCTVSGGDFTDVCYDDQNYHCINECSGTPGFDVNYYFEGLNPAFQYTATFIYQYLGSAGHDIKLRIYNYNTQTFDDVTGNTDDFDNNYPLFEQVVYNLPSTMTNYVSGGDAVLKIIHTSPGVTAHH